MARPRLCEDMLLFKFRPGIAGNRLTELAGEKKHKSKFLRELIDKAALPNMKYAENLLDITKAGNVIVKLGQVRKLDKSGYLSSEYMERNMQKMLEYGEQLEVIARELNELLKCNSEISNRINAKKLEQAQGGSMWLRMSKQQFVKLILIAEAAGMSKAAVLRAWIFGLQLPNKSLEKIAGRLGQIAWLLKHIAGSWRRTACDLKYDEKLIGETDKIYSKGLIIGNLINQLEEKAEVLCPHF